MVNLQEYGIKPNEILLDPSISMYIPWLHPLDRIKSQLIPWLHRLYRIKTPLYPP